MRHSRPQRLSNREPAAWRAFVCRLQTFATLCLALGLTPATVTAQGPLTSQSSPASTSIDASVSLAQIGSVQFRDTPLAEVILILSEQWNVNIIAGSDISGQVNGSFRNESLKSILDSILKANGLMFQQIGNSLVIVSAADGNSARPGFRVEVLDTPVSTAEEMEQLITALRLQMSQDGQLVPITASGKLTVLDTPERIEAVKQLLAQLAPAAPQSSNYVSSNLPPSGESSSNVRSTPAMTASMVSEVLELRPQFIMASDLQPPLAMLVGESNLSVVEQENSIVVFGDPALRQRAQLLMQQLDKPRPQVRITGYIYDVDLGEIEKLGVDWSQRVMTSSVDANGIPRNVTYGESGLLAASAAGGHSTRLFEDAATTAAAGASGGAAAAAAAAPGGGQFLFRTLNSDFELQALIQALQQTRGSRLLADPHVTVVDRHKASLGIVTEIPVQQLTQTQQGGAIGTTTFRDAGITLDVTPRIASDGTIEMEVAPTFSVLAGYQAGNPIIDTRRAQTVVRVNHGQALVIGGLRSKTTVETVKGIPGLMNIKFLGALFRAHDTDVRESELLVFIMPEIVGYCGGLPREMHALEVERAQLSSIQTAVDGPFTPDCRDKHCPHHYPTAKIHNGMQDNGLIGGYDLMLIGPSGPVDAFYGSAPGYAPPPGPAPTPGLAPSDVGFPPAEEVPPPVANPGFGMPQDAGSARPASRALADPAELDLSAAHMPTGRRPSVVKPASFQRTR